MTNIRKLMYILAGLLFVLDLTYLKFWGLWAIIVVSAEPGFHPTRWNVVLATLATLSMALARFGVVPAGAPIAVVSTIACLLIALVSRYSRLREPNSQPS
jgi:uncharacterized membrane protein